LKKKKNIFFIIVSISLIIFNFSCSEDIEVIEPVISKDKIEFPLESVKNGSLKVLYRNYEDENITISMILLSNGVVIENSQSIDFCEKLDLFRNNIIIDQNWILINNNVIITAEKSVINENDHPNYFSYSLPKGTYMITLMDSPSCSKDNYAILDVTTNDGVQYME
tara:strand:- start:244 stop:741 length:498 start_codon:yes stop_codon:yes gene_type:complete